MIVCDICKVRPALLIIHTDPTLYTCITCYKGATNVSSI